jgi:hypothetical protein
MSPQRGRRRARTWLATGAATVASTYALDALATAAGALLVASQILRGLDHWTLLAVLAATYVFWGAGLRVNLRANWALLEATSASTNVLSKAAYDIARSRKAGVRARRIAAGAGYLVTEIAKEAPYYAGAFGAAVVSDSVSSNDALIFLAGANLAAAGYEYGVARLTRGFLARRSRRSPAACASFDTDWVPRDYLRDYYSAVEPDERETIAFFVDAIRDAEPDEPVLFFGVGPTLHHVFLAAGGASEIHLADYLQSNLDEVQRWIQRDPGAHDWTAFVRYTLECEGLASPTDADVWEREELTRAKITRLLRADARLSNPLEGPNAAPYATVVSAYCADSATDDHSTWSTFMEHISGLVRPGGLFVTSALRQCRSYVVGAKRFPSANVDERDLRAALEPDFHCHNDSVQVRHLSEHEAQGYSGIVLASAVKRPLGVDSAQPQPVLLPQLEHV